MFLSLQIRNIEYQQHIRIIINSLLMAGSLFYLYLFFMMLALFLAKWALHMLFFPEETHPCIFEQRRVLLQQQIQPPQRQLTECPDQGNIYTVSDDNTLNSAGGPPRFPAFYYLEPGSEEEARIRAQLEKDERELPSYDEVIRMTTASETVRGDCVAMSTTSIATTATNISLSPCVPPYTEIDMNAIAPATAAPTTPPSTTLQRSISVNEVEAAASPPSTSRAAAITIASPVTSTSA